MPSDQALAGLLRRRFGHAAFRPGQLDLVHAALAGQATLGVLPTGGGKSIAYQLPVLLLPGPTLVVVPLVALARDQARRAAALGIRALTWERDTPRRALAAARLVFTSPERLARPQARDVLAGLGVRHLVIDEAHCVEAWGGSFRPAYALLAGAVAAAAAPAVTLLTATPGPETLPVLAARLGLPGLRLVAPGGGRPELAWHAASCPLPDDLVFRVAAACPGKVLCFTPSRLGTERLALSFQRRGLACAPYHAGLDGATRRRIEAGFAAGRPRVLVATSAFGMGIDIPDIRAVLHAGLPASLAAYRQEAGRAGRDGRPALALLAVPGRRAKAGCTPDPPWTDVLAGKLADLAPEPGPPEEDVLDRLAALGGPLLPAHAAYAFLLWAGALERRVELDMARVSAAPDGETRLAAAARAARTARRREQRALAAYVSAATRAGKTSPFAGLVAEALAASRRGARTLARLARAPWGFRERVLEGAGLDPRARAALEALAERADA